LLDVNPAGSSISLTMDLYKKSPSGNQVDAQVLIGGGAALGNQTTNAKEEVNIEFEKMETVLAQEYTNAKFSRLFEATSSEEMSRYMLETLNDHNHDTRYGSFVIDDLINANLDIDWDEIIGIFDQSNSTTNDVAEFLNISLTSAVDAIGVLNDMGVSANVGFSDQFNLSTDEVIEFSSLFLTNSDDVTGFLNGIGVSANDILELFNSTIAAMPNSGNFINLTDVFSGDTSCKLNLKTDVSIIHNASSAHAIATFNQAYMEYLYKKCSADPSSRLVSMNHPLPLTIQQSLEIQTTLSIITSLFLLIPYCYIPAAFVVFLVKEKANKSKHLQLVSGVETSSYWIATYLWDMSLYTVLTILIMLVFLLFGTESARVFVGNATNFFCTASLTFGYGLSAMPFAYLWSRYFTNPSAAQISIMAIFFFTGFIAVNAHFILISIESTKAAGEGLEVLFLTWPPYVVGDALVKMSVNFYQQVILGSNTSVFDWGVCGKNLALLYGLSVPYSGLLLLLEYSNDCGSGGIIGQALRAARGSWDQVILSQYGVKKTPVGQLLLDGGLDDPSGTSVEDNDVAKERAYVSDNKEQLKTSAVVLLDNLWKVYPPPKGILGSIMEGMRHFFGFCFRNCSCCDTGDSSSNLSSLPKRAVRGLSTSIENGETFGLLGVNGAGKTTTLGILTGDIASTSGSAYIAGHDITSLRSNGVALARKTIGFCPQVDPLLDLMTGRETLVMFGKLRGIQKELLDDEVNRLLDALTLTPHADKVSQSYSGGNKRKLSLGIALIGDPKVLFIDESSSGMDPCARRKIWDLIAEVSKNRSVILTTHSMEEAEALCTKVAVMTSGKMRCLGSVQHLKSTFLEGYTVDLQCSSDASPETVDKAERYVLEVAIPNASLAERHGRFLRFDVPSMSRDGNTSVSLGSTFRSLQYMKDNASYCVVSYSISQCSLEQVFISLVKADEERQRKCLNSI